MKTFKTLSMLALGAAVTLTSCKKDDDTPSSANSSQPDQSFNVRMTDNPGNYERLDVELASVAVLNSNNEWVTLNNNTQTVAVLDLTNGNEKQIAFSSNVEADTYSKVKLKFTQNNTLELNAAASAGLSSSIINVGLNVGASSSTSTTITDSVMIDINQSVSSSSSADILIDFNVAESVIEDNGTYMIDPVITLVADERTGVQGSIENDIRAALMFESNSNSSITYSGFTNEDGEFLIRGMADGTYTLTVMTDEEESATLNGSYTINNVTVVDGDITQMGEVSLSNAATASNS